MATESSTTTTTTGITTVSTQTKIAIGALIVITIFLVAILFRGCQYDKTVSETKAKLQIMVDSVQQREIAANKIITAQAVKIDSIEAQKAIVQKQLAASQVKLDVSESKASSLSQQVKYYKIKKDTVAYYVSCDSLSDVVDSVVAVEKSNRVKSDSILTLYDEKSIAQDSIISQKTKLYSDLRNSWSDVLKQYNSTLVDYNKLEKKYKRERTLTRIVAGVGVVLVGAVIVK